MKLMLHDIIRIKNPKNTSWQVCRDFKGVCRHIWNESVDEHNVALEMIVLFCVSKLNKSALGSIIVKDHQSSSSSYCVEGRKVKQRQNDSIERVVFSAQLGIVLLCNKTIHPFQWASSSFASISLSLLLIIVISGFKIPIRVIFLDYLILRAYLLPFTTRIRNLMDIILQQTQKLKSCLPHPQIEHLEI